ncbi:hypothetical protein IFM89_003662 [Coptis chinensis]|uniref:Flavone synthase II n=1 Tax=Coptis chinensis TaxID=261450 RepID=A0A835LM79_9MAGN|nr:hypothetical protein IFM89_003662 [Coptis chinensis]
MLELIAILLFIPHTMVLEINTAIYTFIFLLLVIFYRKLLSSKSQTGLPCLPPSPRGLPIVGHLHLLNNTPHPSFHNLCTRYGPLIHLRLGSVLCIIASTPELAKELLITNGLTFASRPMNIVINLLTYNSSGFSFAPYGPYWKFLKKIVTSELLGERTLGQLQHIRYNETSQLVHLLVDRAHSGKIVNLSQEVMKLSNNIISQMMLNIRCSGEDEKAREIRSLVREATELVAQFNFSDFIWFLQNLDLQGIKKKAKTMNHRFDFLLEKIITEREVDRNKQKEKRGNEGLGKQKMTDFLSILLDISDDENSSIRLTRENIKAFLFDFLSAGTDTSGIVVEWAMSELINHPCILEKARKEIDSIVGQNRLVNETDIPNLSYIQAIFKETVRLHPPIPIFERESTQDCKIGGYLIPAKTILFISNWSICRDPNNWKDPLEFQPERFMSDSETDDNAGIVDVRGQHFNLLPFGSGRRGCPGVSLAVQVVPTVLALLIQCFHWKIAGYGDEMTGKLVDMTERPGLTVPKAQPLMLVPSTRLRPFPNYADCGLIRVARE